jgi:hypothetical protein
MSFEFEPDSDVTDGIFRNLDHHGCHAGQDAVNVRNKFKEFFSSPVGAVSWHAEPAMFWCQCQLKPIRSCVRNALGSPILTLGDAVDTMNIKRGTDIIFKFISFHIGEATSAY